MPQGPKNFIFKNEPFVCENCGAENGLVKGEIRNHCLKCLYGKHLDLEVPGDRKSACFGLMAPISVFYNGKKGYMIRFECLKCREKRVNKASKDDNFDLLCKLTSCGHDPQ